MEILVTVVTVCYNEKDKIMQTMSSVRKNMFGNVEYVIVDGGSKDGTVDRIKEFCMQEDNRECQIRYISEPDKGIYDAMNKGIQMAKGEFVVFINSGDRLLRLPMKELEEVKEQEYYGAAFPVAMDWEDNLFVPRFDKSIRTHNTLHHQGLFYRRELLEPYDTKYRIFADFDYNQKLFKQGKKVAVFKETDAVAIHDTQGVSHAAKYVVELLTVIRGNYGLWYCFLGFLYGGMNMVKNRMKKAVKG